MTTDDFVKCEWVTSPVLAKILGIHRQTLLRLRRSSRSPFVEGRDFRWSGMTTNSNLQWHARQAELTFTQPLQRQGVDTAREPMPPLLAASDPEAKIAYHKGQVQSFRGRVKRLEALLHDAFSGAQKRALAHCLIMEDHLDPNDEAHALEIKRMEDEVIDICHATDQVIEFLESYDLHA